ncbi:MAG: glycosyltransferase family 2 protein [Bacteroidales bacterium]
MTLSGEAGYPYSKIAVVILNWNGKNFLEKFLPQLVKNSNHPDISLWVVDNGSNDNSVNYIKSNFQSILLIEFSENYGFTGGYNRALQLIPAEYFVVLNSDVEVTENWILPVIRFMDNNPDVAACQPKIKSYHNKEYFEYAGAAGGFIDRFGYPFCRGRILKTIEKDTAQYDKNLDIFWASGACMIIRSEIFKEVGGFDEEFFAHMEEIDLCWRIINRGKRIVCYTDSVVYHVGGGALPNNSPRKLYLNYRNNLFVLYKNLNARELFPVIFQRLMLDGLSALIYLVSFNFSFFFIVFKAHIHFYRKITAMHKKRKDKNLNLSGIKEIYNRSMIIDYFVKKRWYFSEMKFNQ